MNDIFDTEYLYPVSNNGAGDSHDAQSTDSLKAHMIELDELMSAKLFEIVDRSSLPADARIYSTQTVNFVKENNEMRVVKSRLIAQSMLAVFLQRYRPFLK